MPVVVLLYTSYRICKTLGSLNTVIFSGISTLPPTFVFSKRTTLHLRAFLCALITWKNFKSMLFLLLMKEVAWYIFGNDLFVLFFQSDEIQRAFSQRKENFNFSCLSLMIHIFSIASLLPAEKIQQIKIVKAALLLQSNIPTVTDFKLFFGIALQQCGIMYACQWKDSFCCLYSVWKKVGKALLSCSKKAEQNASPFLMSGDIAVYSHIPHHLFHWSGMWSRPGLNPLVTYFWWVNWTSFISWPHYS